MTLPRGGAILAGAATRAGIGPRKRAEDGISFSKAIDLLKLADFAASRHSGVTLDDIAEAFGVHHRTAQRMTQALLDAFPHAVDVTDGPDRRRRWKLREVPLARLRLTGADELEALDLAAARLRDEGDLRHARAIATLRDRLLAALPAPDARRAEADADAMLEAWGVAARPGPAVKVDADLAEMIAAALRGPFRLRFTYSGTRREVEPYGVLLGARRYLVARQPDKDSALRHFRLDRIEAPELTEIWFVRDPDFDLQQHAARAFGSWQNEAQFGEVVWRFAPEAAERAAEWRFHPHQSREWLQDGRLEIRFRASGWLEMAWHLYQWGDTVEVVAPEPLRRMVAGWQRDDLEALP
ncbi:MAG: helix-turn-helix transcriptional regulator [Paracoccaceae bacterium]